MCRDPILIRRMERLSASHGGQYHFPAQCMRGYFIICIYLRNVFKVIMAIILHYIISCSSFSPLCGYNLSVHNKRFIGIGRYCFPLGNNSIIVHSTPGDDTLPMVQCDLCQCPVNTLRNIHKANTPILCITL